MGHDIAGGGFGVRRTVDCHTDLQFLAGFRGVLAADQHHRHRGAGENRRGDGAKEELREVRETPGSHHDQIRLLTVRFFSDHLSGVSDHHFFLSLHILQNVTHLLEGGFRLAVGSGRTPKLECRNHQFGRLLHIENANLRIKVLKLRAARDHVRGMDTVFTAINRKQNFHIGSF